MSDRRKEAEEKMAKAIFISADCWLCVFDLLPVYKLGLGISMISRRFDFYVDEHFKTRKWTLAFIEIRRKIGENGTKEMEIVNIHRNPLPIPQIQLPRKVIGFRSFVISYIDQNAITFLRRFRPIFASNPIHLSINMWSDRILELILRNIWPMFAKNICWIFLHSEGSFTLLRKLVPSILNNCPSLRVVSFNFVNLFIAFPAEDSAVASDGQALAKWLFTPLQSNVPKVLRCSLVTDDGTFESTIEAFKAAFSNASSPVNFIVVLYFPFPFADSVVPFVLINEFTREQLTLEKTGNNYRFLFVRCPIARDASKWTKWEEEAIGWKSIDNHWNNILIQIINEDQIGDGLLDAIPGPSDQKK
ncbi:hypothetical protein niasHT_005513 [Heterodera trifolii]|uniref:Uncharacterized protein n=1 Tax=Heterodera trifolii TaxID=157864 RepID=A0ABD2LSU1_9BILA